MNHPYRGSPSPGSALGEGSGAIACWCCERRAVLATERRRRLLRVLTTCFVIVVGVSSTALTFKCLKIMTRLTAAVAQLNEVAEAMNTTAAGAAPPPVCAPSTAANKATAKWPTGRGIQKLDENKFRVDQRVTLALLEEGANVPGPTLIPESEKGCVGLWITGLRPDSLVSRLGIENGDRVESINGMAMHSPKDLLEAYAHPPMSNHLSVIVMRRGSKVRLDYYLV